jgi:hypothetical protein
MNGGQEKATQRKQLKENDKESVQKGMCCMAGPVKLLTAIPVLHEERSALLKVLPVYH